MDRPLRIVSIATLFPGAARPNVGLFVEQSLRALAAQAGIELTIVAPLGLPPFPLSLHRRYRALRDRPRTEQWNGLTVLRPRFPLIPRYGARFNPAPVSRAVLAPSLLHGSELARPKIQGWHQDFTSPATGYAEGGGTVGE